MPKPEPKPTKQSKSFLIEEILNRGDKKETRALFAFDSTSTEEEILVKLNLWTRWFFPQYFKSADAAFHKHIDSNNLGVYRGRLKSFVDIVFRGGVKTTRTKLFMAFAISNDLDHSRKYFKVLTEDGSNSKQIVTDVYNMLISPRVHYYYSEVFEKTVGPPTRVRSSIA